MIIDNVPRVTPDWLGLREPADAAARAADLADLAREQLAGRDRLVIHDLGSGTGSMARWLAPRLPGPQQWILYDRDTVLLDCAGSGAIRDADGREVGVRTRDCDITRLTGADLAGASLITASALLDMFTAAELERVVDACAAARCPVLFTISVTGQVEFAPPDPLDAELVEAFNAHQRRTTGGRTLLGPDAVPACARAFTERGLNVTLRPSHWQLGAAETDLIREWLAGWLDAACEQRPELAEPAAAYAARRHAEAAAGRLSVAVHHDDLLATHFMNP